MAIIAKTILKDKFWIMESNDQKIGTLSYNDERYMFSSPEETCFFNNTRQIKKRFGQELEFITFENKIEQEYFVQGYPTSTQPFNSMFDVKKRLPLFTKSDKSKSLYCAGYYIIKFDKGWVKSFCPKLITVERYETKGPFKTELEMRQELSNVNN